MYVSTHPHRCVSLSSRISLNNVSFLRGPWIVYPLKRQPARNGQFTEGFSFGIILNYEMEEFVASCHLTAMPSSRAQPRTEVDKLMDFEGRQ